jgi:hypothetical protein
MSRARRVGGPVYVSRPRCWICLDEGNIADALRCYGTLRHLVRTELAVSPSRRFEELIEPYRPRGPSPPAAPTGSGQRHTSRRWA